MPDVVAVNGAPCSVQSAALLPPPPPQSSREEAASSLTTVNGQIIGLDGQPLTLWGINWFGFETGTTMLDGLWAGAQSLGALHWVGPGRTCSSTTHACQERKTRHPGNAALRIGHRLGCFPSLMQLSLMRCAAFEPLMGRGEWCCGAGSDALTMDFATIVYRLQLLGFNAVRLPFSFANLYDEQPQSQVRNCGDVRLKFLLPLVSCLCAILAGIALANLQVCQCLGPLSSIVWSLVHSKSAVSVISAWSTLLLTTGSA